MPNPLHQITSLKPSISKMGFCRCKETMFLFLLFSSLFLSTQETQLKNNTNLSFYFPLTSLPRSVGTSPTLSSFLVSGINNNNYNNKRNPTTPRTSSSASTSSPSPSIYNYRLAFKYSMALIVSLPIGTPPQTQQMVLDTGSQLSWIQCNKKPPRPPTTSFDPSLSSSFSVLPCSHPLCKPRIPDFTLPTSCDQNRFCHYSYFYADGTLAEGNLVREKFTFSSSQSTPPLILGCATDSAEEKGILGMNLGRLSFPSQAKISKFSYCVPTRQNLTGSSYSTGSFYLGQNPNSGGFQYINLLTFPQSRRSPNLDPLAYTVAMQGIRIGNTKLNISASAFRPDPSGSGQTIIDSGSEFTYLVDAAYDKVREEIVRLVGPRLKKGYVYGGVADMCFDGDAIDIGRSIGNMVLEFEKGVEIVVGRERVLADVGGGVHCVSIGRSEMLGAASNIIGNIHQQNLWVEFDLANRKVGIGRADCSRSV